MTREIGDSLHVTGTFNVDSAVGAGIAPTSSNLIVLAGTSTNDAAVGGVLYVSAAAVGNIGTGDDDLMTYTVPANTLSATNMSLRFKAWGSYANNANAKTLKVKFGSDVWIMSSYGSTSAKWVIEGTIVRTGAATQDVCIECRSVTGGSLVQINMDQTAAAQTLANANVLKLTGTGTSNNDLLQEGFVIEWLDANT